jgi:hypothetical protein
MGAFRLVQPLAQQLRELSQTSNTTLKRVASGQITLSQSGEIFDRIEARRRVIDTQNLATRVSALEQSHKEDKKTRSSDSGSLL